MAYDDLNSAMKGLFNSMKDTGGIKTGKDCPLCGSPIERQPSGRETCSKWPGCPNSTKDLR